MAKVNYSYQKKQRELATKRKQEEKIKDKLQKKELADKGRPETAPNEDSAAG